MTTFDRPLFVIRRVGSQDYSAGYGAYAVPKLYTRGSANSVVGRKNKEAERYDWKDRWEAVPVTITIVENG
jgi:hypothetical protein